MRSQSESRAALMALEKRVRQLEKRLQALEKRQPVPRVKLSEPRKRSALVCPGCQLDLPHGHKRVECVWCGFRLDAVKPEKHRSSAA